MNSWLISLLLENNHSRLFFFLNIFDPLMNQYFIVEVSFHHCLTLLKDLRLLLAFGRTQCIYFLRASLRSITFDILRSANLWRTPNSLNASSCHFVLDLLLPSSTTASLRPF
jgi:hypothetical protein